MKEKHSQLISQNVSRKRQLTKTYMLRLARLILLERKAYVMKAEKFVGRMAGLLFVFNDGK